MNKYRRIKQAAIPLALQLRGRGSDSHPVTVSMQMIPSHTGKNSLKTFQSLMKQADVCVNVLCSAVIAFVII
jgi:hypothetical protein